MRLCSVQNLMDRSRRAADMEAATGFVSDAELLDHLDNGVTELHDLLVSAYGEDYFHTTQIGTFVVNQVTYSLPDDFFKGKGVDVELNANEGTWRPIGRWNERERTHGEGRQAALLDGIEYRYRGNTVEFKPPPADTRRYRLQYVPTSPRLIKTTFATGDVSTANDTITLTDHGLFDQHPVRFTTTGTLPAPLAASTTYWIIRNDANSVKVASSAANARDGTAIDLTDTGSDTHTIMSMVDGINGWEELVVLHAAIRMANKEESDSRALKDERNDLRNRLQAMADNRDQGEPATIQDVEGGLPGMDPGWRWPPPL